ncbi:MAG: hypothetical protein ACRD5I_03755 [Candidatus Acidiferrales bacterium]
MKRCTSFIALLSMTLFLCALPLTAQGHGQGQGQGGGKPSSPPSQRPSPPPRPETQRAPESKGKAEEAGARKTTSQQLAQNPKLSARLEKLLPGTNVHEAAGGFKSVGQLVAAAHVSNNLGIPFAQLKSTMVGPPEKSLGEAIHQINPDVDAKAEAKKAEKQAKKDMDDSRRSE